MDTQKAPIVERLKQANNILVTVSANPTVDQLSAAIGMTLLLNKLGKHATAVFSGVVPSVLEFLEPSKTLEADTNSLRDFIISLDKNKADKLRYKVEDNHVRIFITPYRTSISDKDLVFSQGDFNVEVVLALGVTKQQDLDKAISAHGRILHDATVIDISTTQVSGMGALNLIDPKASSLSEILVDIGTTLKPDVLDMQMATAFLTGIVAETNRFSNDKTTSATMEVSSKLLAAGANQQLVATKLQPPKPATPPPAPVPTPTQTESAPASAASAAPAATAEPAATLPKPQPNQVAADGSLTIDHGPAVDLDTYELSDGDDEAKLEQIHIDDQGHLKTVEAEQQAVSAAASAPASGHKVLEPLSAMPASAPTDASAPTGTGLEPPALGGTLTASGSDNETEPSVNPMAATPATDAPLLSHDVPAATAAGSLPGDNVLPVGNTLADIEKSVQSPHVAQASVDAGASSQEPASAPPVEINVDEARDAVNNLTAVSPDQPLPPIQALGAQYVDLPGVGGTTPDVSVPAVPAQDPATQPAAAPQPVDPTAPPPVPPPMMPPSFTPAPPAS
jgi:hypothetical protein